MTSWYQNAWLLLDSMSTPIITFRERPCMPAKVMPIAAQENCTSVKVVCANDVVVEWYKDGTVKETLPNGDKTIFPARPTYSTYLSGSYVFAEFFLGYLLFQNQQYGNYFEFKANGTTVYRRNGLTFLWSPEFPGKEVEGVITYTVGEYDEDFWRAERSDSFS
jgi:hypothetical protein